jgi:hypothetical protein
LTLLCEGDMTFRAYDIDKFPAYPRTPKSSTGPELSSNCATGRLS